MTLTFPSRRPDARRAPVPVDAGLSPATDGSPGERGFAQLVGALQLSEGAPLRSPPRKPRRRAPAPPAERCSPGAALARAEQCARSGRIDEALSICEAVLPGLQAAGDPLALGLCQHVQALSHHYAGRLQAAMLAGYRAIECLGRTEALDRRLRAMALQAIVLARLGDAAAALELLDHGLHLLPRVAGHPREQCVFWNNAGAALHALGQLPQAVEAAMRAAALMPLFDEPPLHAVCRGNVLVYRVELAQATEPPGDELRQALGALQAHIDELVHSERHHLMPRCVKAAAGAQIALGRLDEARELLGRGIRSALLAGVGPERGGLELRLAQVERLGGRYRAAAGHVALALELLHAGQEQDLLAEAHLENGLLHEAQQHWRAALDSHKRHAELRAALLKAQAEGRAQAAAARMDLACSRQEVETLRRRNAELERRLAMLEAASAANG
ncbi:hypothetical protein [Eleftheria terrae]|uniref:hypothetical protein n=1 Tax=Eleftheria terrae TaxID=1597781 RepID=UPI00263B8456|nr:hypothetical protein [Eleftheria terrae]WKB51788.1 hypothetical protein N7L95_18570 [Eleftheria terrae]